MLYYVNHKVLSSFPVPAVDSSTTRLLNAFHSKRFELYILRNSFEQHLASRRTPRNNKAQSIVMKELKEKIVIILEGAYNAEAIIFGTTDSDVFQKQVTQA